MEEEFEFGFSEDPKFSVERYEEMIRNQDQYFFDAQAFENIIDYYIEKNDPIKALQVVEYALSQHPFVSVFLVKQAQLFLVTNLILLQLAHPFRNHRRTELTKSKLVWVRANFVNVAQVTPITIVFGPAF